MALFVRKALASNVPRRCLALSSVNRADMMMPDPVEHATGILLGGLCGVDSSMRCFRFGKVRIAR